MRTAFWLGLSVGLAVWVVILRRQLVAEQQRGDMYRQISARLDSRVAALSSQRS